MNPDLPVEGDLQHHSVGCYTAESQIKKLNRTAELALVTAEKLRPSVPGWWHVIIPKPRSSKPGSASSLQSTTASPVLHFPALPDDRPKVTATHRLGNLLTSPRRTRLGRPRHRSRFEVPRPVQSACVAHHPANAEYDIGFPFETAVSVEDEAGRPVPHQSVEASSESTTAQRLVVRMPTRSPLSDTGRSVFAKRKTRPPPVMSTPLIACSRTNICASPSDPTAQSPCSTKTPAASLL